jgi:hypothetical protein
MCCVVVRRKPLPKKNPKGGPELSSKKSVGFQLAHLSWKSMLKRYKKKILPEIASKPQGRGRSGSIANRRSHSSVEDLEGLLLNAGVIAALVLSFSVGLFNSIGINEYQKGAYNRCMLTEHVYRETLVEVLESKDPPFNLTVSPTRGRFVDLKHILLTKYPAKSIPPERFGLEPEEYAKDIQLVADLLWDETPFALLHLALELDNRPRCSYAADLSFKALCANTALSISLFGSLMLYVSLSLSSAKESKKGEVAKTWIQSAMLSLYACYLTLAVGLTSFFIGLADTSELRSPTPYYTRRYVFFS